MSKGQYTKIRDREQNVKVEALFLFKFVITFCPYKVKAPTRHAWLPEQRGLYAMQ